jgi:hypothetical protein
MTYTSFDSFLSSSHGTPAIANALTNSFQRSFSSDCNGFFGANFEISFSDEINSLNLGVLCVTNKELDFYYTQNYVIDCSSFGSPNWDHFKIAIKSLFHPISASDVYLVSVDQVSRNIKILDGLSIKTSTPQDGKPSVNLHNDADGLAWDVVDNLVNNQQDARSNGKIGNVLIVRGNSQTGLFNSYFFKGCISDVYNCFPKGKCVIGTKNNYVFTGKTQAVIVTNRKVLGTGTSFYRGIQLKDPAFGILMQNQILRQICHLQVPCIQLRKDYMQQRHGF